MVTIKDGNYRKEIYNQMKWSRKYGAFKVRFIRSGLMTHGGDVCTRSKTYARDSHEGDY